ncbi:androgen-induced gene 1 protein-like [Tubulanus polymorphus]|uniref:androgen-induced gene 1 protein-like n=1 Tax=Tubulanus polymorphus TaxID=672921 RepID=UPI003DA67D03
MKSAIATLLHLSICGVYAYSIWYDAYEVKLPRPSTYAGKWKYLTFWNLWIQGMLFGVCFLNDLFGTDYQPGDPRRASLLQRIRDYTLSVIALPVGLFVVTSFWSIFAYNRELIFPVALDKFFPSWLNHIMHTTVIVFLFVEMLMTNHHCPSLKRCIKGLSLFALVYGLWVLWIAYYANIWVYPVLAVLPVSGRVIFILSMYIYFLVLSCVCYKLKRAVWAGRQPHAVSTKKR